MRRIHYVIIVSSLVLGLLAQTSCRREPLHEPKSAYYLDLDISLDALHKKPSMPSFVTAIFYDHTTGDKVFQEYFNANGGYLYGAVPGTYDILLYSLGTTYTHVDSLGRIDQAYAYTNPISQGYELKYEPDHLLVGTIYNQEIPALVEKDSTFIMKGYMETLLDTWKLEVYKIKGLQYATSIGIMIDGLCDSKKLATGLTSEREMKLYFAGVIDNEYKLISTPFNIFGKLAGVVSKLDLQISVVGDDGASYKLKTDITDQFNDPENTEHIIRVEFDIEIKAKEGGGFQPTVDEWTTIVENFEL